MIEIVREEDFQGLRKKEEAKHTKTYVSLPLFECNAENTRPNNFYKPVIFLISFNLFNASRGVRELMSIPLI